MKLLAFILARLPLLPTILVAAQPTPWTIGERNSRSCLLTPEGEPFKLLNSLRKRLCKWRVAQNDHVPVCLTSPYVAPGRTDPIPAAKP